MWDRSPPGVAGRTLLSATVDEAYRFKSAIVDVKPSSPDDFVFLTSGAIDRYHHAHGSKRIRYLKSDFEKPYLRSDSEELSAKRKRQYAAEKLIIAGMTKRLEAIWDDGRCAGAVPTVQIIKKSKQAPSLKFLLGLVNSRLIDWVFKQYFDSLSLAGGYLRIGVPQIVQIPICRIDESRRRDVELRDCVISNVKTMLELWSRADHATTAHARKVFMREIEHVDQEIDRAVFELYGLSDEERRIVTDGD